MMIPVINDDQETEEISGMHTLIWPKYPASKISPMLGIRPLAFKSFSIV